MHTLESKGLKKGAISRSTAVMIGLAATAPAYSLSGALGYGAAESGYQLPIIFILSVIYRRNNFVLIKFISFFSKTFIKMYEIKINARIIL